MSRSEGERLKKYDRFNDAGLVVVPMEETGGDVPRVSGIFEEVAELVYCEFSE